MRTVKWNAYLSGLCTLAVALGVLAGGARADVVTEKGASMLIFPAVAGNGNVAPFSEPSRQYIERLVVDTVIEITNTSNSMVHARCFYTDARLPPGCEREAPQLGCVSLCQTIDFSIWLTKQQPTHWLVSKGRPTDPSDDFVIGADGAGIDPGPIPPTPPGFLGDLRCVEVTADGLPIGGNHLIGTATLVTTDLVLPSGKVHRGDVLKYNAIGIQGTENVGATGNVLQLNNPRGTTLGQYNACPQTLVLNHIADFAPEPVIKEIPVPTSSAVLNVLTIDPCSRDYQNNEPGRVTVQFEVFNEFEERFSASTTVTCVNAFLLSDLASVFSYGVLGSVAAQTRITPADDEDGGVVGVAVTIRVWLDREFGAAAAANIHTEGDRFFGTDGGAFDEIIMSDEF